jgi:hypothetical protein
LRIKKVIQEKKKEFVKADELLNFINEITREALSTPLDYRVRVNNSHVVFHIPLCRVYPDFIKRKKEQIYEVIFSSLGRMEMSVLKGTSFITENGEIYFLVPDDTFEDYPFYPKIPFELLEV